MTSFVLDEILQLEDEISREPQHLLGVVVLGHFLRKKWTRTWNDVSVTSQRGDTSKRRTVEELDDVGEVHVVVDDDVAVELHERQRHEQDEVRRADAGRSPHRLPHAEHVLVHQLCTVHRPLSYETSDEKSVR